MLDMTHSEILLSELTSFLGDLKSSKPNDRSELDRRFQILITDIERAIAWLATYIVPLDTRDAGHPALAQDQVWEQNE